MCPGDVRPLQAALCVCCPGWCAHHTQSPSWPTLVEEITAVGEPKEYANWYDEHLNATLASVAKLAYPAVYERRVLAYFKLALESQIKHRR